MPDGSRRVTTNAPALDGRSILGQEVLIKTDGSSEEFAASATWWDAGRDTVCFHYLNNTGLSVMGEMVSLTFEGDSATMVSRHQGTDGSGHAVATTITRVLKGDTLVSTFTDFSSEGMTAKPSWVGVPLTSKRTGEN